MIELHAFIQMIMRTVSGLASEENSVLQFVKGDLQSGDLINYVLRTEDVDTVLHFAAQVRRPFMTLIFIWCLLALTGMGHCSGETESGCDLVAALGKANRCGVCNRLMWTTPLETV